MEFELGGEIYCAEEFLSTSGEHGPQGYKNDILSKEMLLGIKFVFRMRGNI